METFLWGKSLKLSSFLFRAQSLINFFILQNFSFSNVMIYSNLNKYILRTGKKSTQIKTGIL